MVAGQSGARSPARSGRGDGSPACSFYAIGGLPCENVAQVEVNSAGQAAVGMDSILDIISDGGGNPTIYTVVDANLKDK